MADSKIPPVPFFDSVIGDERTQMGPKWDRWLLRLENYMIAENITTDARKRATLLHYVGEKTFEDFLTLPNTGNDYKTAKDKLTDHFKPQVFTEYSKAVFRNMRQETSETIDAYYVRLKKQAGLCGFDDTEIKSHIVQTCRDSKVRNKYLKPSNDEKTLTDVLNDARNNELCALQNAEIEKTLNLPSNSSNSSESVNVMQRGRGSQPRGRGRGNWNKGRGRGFTPQNTSGGRNFSQQGASGGSNATQCMNCGGVFPHRGGFSACPAFNSECGNCGRIGHFGSLCRSSQSQGGHNHRGQNRGRNRGQNRGFNRGGQDNRRSNRGRNNRNHWGGNRDYNGRNNRVHNVEDDELNSDSDYLFHIDLCDDVNCDYTKCTDNDNIKCPINCYHIKCSVHDHIKCSINDVKCSVNDVTCPVNDVNEQVMNVSFPKFKVQLLDVPVQMIADTAASCSIVDECTYDKLLAKKFPLGRKSNVKPYGCSTIQSKGSFQTTVSFQDRSVEERFHVMPGNNGCLLSLKASQALQLVQLSDHVVNKIENQYLSQIRNKFPSVLSGVGLMKDYKVKLHVDSSVKPVAQPHRRIPFHLRKKVEDKLKSLQEADIIEPVTGPTPWVSPIVVVPKRNSEEIRICTDMRQANKAIIRERHITPTLKEIQARVNGSQVFSKIDLRSGYNQLLLDENSRYITTFSTHAGLFRAKRLCFGISSASEVFQAAVAHVLSDIPNAINISDDIIIFGTDKKQHDQVLMQTCARLAEYGLTINTAKCEFGLEKISFFGMVFGPDGMSPDPEKIKSLKQMKPPTNIAEVRSLLGMVNYSSRYIPNYASIMEPITRLTRKQSKFQWGLEQQQAFNTVIQKLSENPVLAYYNVDLPTQILVDASPVGIAALLTQKHKGESKVVAYASRSLTDTERRYCQLEREALACVWGLEHFHLHVYGKPEIEVLTDHKPLLGLFGNPNAKLSARLERWSLRLQPYQPIIKYRRGSDNPADYLSRHPESKTTHRSITAPVEEYVHMLADVAVPKAMTMNEIVNATENDETLKLVKFIVQNNSWNHVKDRSIDSDVRVDYKVLDSFRRVSLELCVTANGLILRGSRIVIPEVLQQHVVNLAHEGHQGINKTKALLREKVWFPGIDDMVARKIAECVTCRSTHDSKPREPLQMTVLPDRPWQAISMDFYGPLPSGHYLLVVMDDYSRFPEVKITTSTSAKQTLSALDEIFSSRGVPEVVRSDNGSPFQSEAFKLYAAELGFRHRKVTPYWPEANGGAESFMKGLGKTTRSSQLAHRDWKRDMYRFLANYRATPHQTTGKPPATVLNGYPIRIKLPEFSDILEKDPAGIGERDRQAKNKMKYYAERRRNIKPGTLGIGDKVLLKRMTPQNKLSTKFDPNPYQVIDRKGSMIIAQRGTEIKARNSIHCKRLVTEKEPLLFDHKYDDDVIDVDDQIDVPEGVPIVDVPEVASPQRASPQRASPQRTSPQRANLQRNSSQRNLNVSDRPKRVSNPPRHLQDFVVKMPKLN